jgi:hypothetical protein
MTEKIAEYAAAGAEWPLAANILDPIRSVPVRLYVCACLCVHSQLADPPKV